MLLARSMAGLGTARLLAINMRLSVGMNPFTHFDVLPILLKQGRKEIGSQLHIKAYLIFRLIHIGHGHTEAHDLLHLELNSSSDSITLLL